MDMVCVVMSLRSTTVHIKPPHHTRHGAVSFRGWALLRRYEWKFEFAWCHGFRRRCACATRRVVCDECEIHDMTHLAPRSCPQRGFPFSEDLCRAF